MNSKEFIIEGEDKETLLKFIELIKQDCQPYLHEARPYKEDRNLLRGMGNNAAPFLHKQVRLGNRKPKDIPLELHNTINDYFDKQYGGSFRNSLFATNDYVQAENYGDVYYIFPIGDFSFLWSPDIEDLFMLYDDYAPWFGPAVNLSPEEQEKRKQEAMKEFFEKEIKGGVWYNSNLDHGIASGNEVMLRCSNYYAVSLIAIERAPSEFFRMLE